MPFSQLLNTEKIYCGLSHMSWFPKSQNKSIFASVVWLSCIHMRLNGQVVIVVWLTQHHNHLQKSGKRGKEKMKENSGSKGNPRRMTLSRHKSKLKWTLQLHTTLAEDLIISTSSPNHNISQKAQYVPQTTENWIQSLSQICHCDCCETPSTLRNQILHLTVRATWGDLAKLAHTKHPCWVWLN